MDEWVAFVRARLDEDEAAAEAAAQSGNHFTEPGGHDPRWQRDAGHNGGQIRDMCSPRGCIVVFDEGAPGPEQAAHIEYHDPARVLRDVAGMRAILDLCGEVISDDEGHEYWSDGWSGLAVARRAVRALAVIWESHPGYPGAPPPAVVPG